MFTEALLNTSLKGTGKFGRTSIFPCGIFQYMKGVNDKPGTPNYDLKKLAIKSTSMRLYPNYANNNWKNNESWIAYDRQVKQAVLDELNDTQKDALKAALKNDAELGKLLYLTNDLTVIQDVNPIEYFSTMGCRTANGSDINFKDTYKQNIESVIETGKLKSDFYSAAQKDGRGNICPTTIILPKLAMLAKQEHPEDPVSAFMYQLEKVAGEAKDLLVERFNYIASQSPAAAKFMYENHTMSGYVPEEGIRSALKHGTLALGQIGMAETLIILIGKDQTTDEGMELAKRIEQLLSNLCAQWKKEYKLNFGVYYTPAENLCFTSFKKWKDEFGDYEGVTYYIDADGVRHDKLYFTNSIHVPVYVQIDPHKKIDIESQLTGYSTAGCITYVEVEHEAQFNQEALEELVDYAMDHDIPYFAVNLPNDSCEDCGYRGHIGETCPKCGSTHISRLRRVTGYLTGDYKSAFNAGKVVETDQRVKHRNITSFE